MKKIVLQWELEDVLYHRHATSTNGLQSVAANEKVYVLRRHTAECLLELSYHFELSIWCRYDPETTGAMVDQLRGLGLQFRYAWDRQRCTEFNDREVVKRWKYLVHMGIEEQQLIMVEARRTHHYDRGNQFLIAPFIGDPDDVLLDATQELIALAGSSNTTNLGR